ncbi:hypothetical protein D3C72_1142700 [compost metagenome]
MAKSVAKKLRERRIREGKYDPANSRGSWNGVNPQLKVIPNKKKDAKNSSHDYSRVYNLVG